jgi:hypothetical protein
MKATTTLLAIVAAAALCLWPASLLAEPPANPGSYEDTVSRLNTFQKMAAVALKKTLTDGELASFVDKEWTFFTVILLLGLIGRYAMRGVQVEEILVTLLMIAGTRILLNNYDSLTSALWGWSEGIAGGIQRAFTGSTNAFFLPGYINNIIEGIKSSEADLFGTVTQILGAVIATLMAFILSMLAFLVNVWALWGYTLAKIVGWVFIPFLLFRRLSMLFDGWLRLFFGFLVYAIIARANLLLVTLAVNAYFGIPIGTIPIKPTYNFDFQTLSEVFGLLAFLLIGILSLISTGRFAATIASGAVGAGDAMRGVAIAVVRLGTRL